MFSKIEYRKGGSLFSNGTGQFPKQAETFLAAVFIIFNLYLFRIHLGGNLVKLPLFAISLFTLLFFRKPLYRPWFWMGWFLFCLFYIFKYYASAANHFFVSAYLCIAILLFLITGYTQHTLLQFHIRCLLGCILLCSAIHKTLSPNFMNGSFFQLFLDTGELLKPVSALAPSWQEAVMYNKKALGELLKTSPDGDRVVALAYPTPHLATLALASAWLSILFEALAGICIFLFAGKKFSHAIMIMTILGIFIFRLETGFLSMLAAMGILLAPNQRMQNLYSGLFILFASLLAAGIGLK